MSTCADCKFWNAKGDGPSLHSKDWETELESAHRRCLKALHGNGDAARSGLHLSDEPMMTLDGSGYTASLFTLPTFSCAAFEARP